LILRTHSRDELFSLFRSAEGIMPKEDPEAWREENRKKQAAGVRFENYDGSFWWGMWCTFNGNKEDYREVPQEVQKDGDIRIPDAMNWATIKDMFKQGLKLEVNANFNGVWRKLTKDPKWSGFSKGQLRIPTQPIPAGMSVEAVESMWRQGLMLEFDGNFGWDLAADGFDWNGIYRGAQLLARLRIPAQPIPEKLLEVSPPTPHAAERALWKAQREAGTNEAWQKRPKIGGIDWADIRHDLMFEPGWDPDWDYRVKPMKLTARICRSGMGRATQEWQFLGTREEYRAECEKYGYVVISEIKEVVEKPETVKYYFALCKTPDGYIGAKFHEDKQRLTDWIITCCGTIIGDIEEREIEA
jgi:hypothetical protein